MKRTNAIIRQGDVALIRIKSLPNGATHQPIDGERLILAFGEATGHHHSIAAGKVRKYTDPGTQAAIVEVAEAMALLEHQEHSAAPLKKGFYRVHLQREYHPEEIRRVAD